MLSFVYDSDDLRWLEVLRPDALRGRVVAFEVNAHVALLQRGITHLTPWDLVATAERPRLERFCRQVLGFWDRHAAIDDHGLDLLGVARYRHHCSLRQMAWMVYVIRRALETCRPRRVAVFEVRSGHGLQQPPGYRKMPMFFALLRGMAERCGCTVDLLQRPGQADLGFVDKVALDARAVHPAVDLAAAVGGRDYVLFCGNGADLLRQLPVIRALDRPADPVVLQVYKSADPEILETLRSAGHRVCHESQLTQGTPALLDLPAAAAARGRFDDARRTLDGPLGDLFNNRPADIHFDFVFGEYACRVGRHARAWRALFGACRPQMVLGNFALPALELAHHLGIPCLELGHGMIVMGHVLNTLCLSPWAVGALSATHQAKLLARGARAAAVPVTGDPWFAERMVRMRQAPAETDALRRRLNLKPAQRLVLLLTGNLGLYSRMDGMPVVDWAEAVRCARALGEVCRRRAEWRLVVRCHPRFDHPQLYEWVSRTQGCGRMAVLPAMPLEPIARLADVVVVSNATTSAMIEVSRLDRPVVLLDAAMCWYEPEDWGLAGWHHVHSVAELEAELQALFASEALYRRRLEQTRRAVNDYLGDDAEAAITRCAALIRGRCAAPVSCGDR